MMKKQKIVYSHEMTVLLAQGNHNGVRMKNRIMRYLEKFDFRQKSLTSLRFKKASNFEFAKLGRFGSITWVNDLV